MKQSKKVLAFIEALQKLEDEFDLTIQGCGCCGSPWVESSKEYVDDLESLRALSHLAKKLGDSNDVR